MTKRMLIDAAHAEETRVVIVDHGRISDYDFVTTSKAQLKGNVYLADPVAARITTGTVINTDGGRRV